MLLRMVAKSVAVIHRTVGWSSHSPAVSCIKHVDQSESRIGTNHFITANIYFLLYMYKVFTVNKLWFLYLYCSFFFFFVAFFNHYKHFHRFYWVHLLLACLVVILTTLQHTHLSITGNTTDTSTWAKTDVATGLICLAVVVWPRITIFTYALVVGHIWLAH